MGIFFVVVVGANEMLRYFSSGIVEVQNNLQAEILAKNGSILAKNIFLHESSGNWTSHVASLTGSPKEADFHLSFDGTKYSITLGDVFEGPINLYSEAENGSTTTKFYRKIHLKQQETWGLYEIETSVCFQKCEYSKKVYEIFRR